MLNIVGIGWASLMFTFSFSIAFVIWGRNGF